MTHDPGDRRALFERALIQIRELQARLAEHDRRASEPIAVIGLGCRFPGSDGPDELWQLVRGGRDAISPLTGPLAERPELTAGAPSARFAGLIAGADQFDAEFFGISPLEAGEMDPQQRVFLEVAWEAIEHAGQTLDQLRRATTGVFVGAYTSDYLLLRSASRVPANVYTGAGNAHSLIANRLSYLLGLGGPSLAVDTACSSSLVALHLACQSLRAGECETAIAGGVNVVLSAETMRITAEVLPLAGDGRCKAFAAAADGIVRAEGAGAVVLKPLSRALADGDRVLAAILGSAANHDGKSNGLTAPSMAAQRTLISRALAAARVEPAEVDYIETHGTGTRLGDPIEVEALRAIYGTARGDGRGAALGAVKTNLGHLEAAAGIAGFIKAVLALSHSEIPPNVMPGAANPDLALAGSRLFLPTEPIEWPANAPRRCAVSSFGLGGANAHVVLGDPPDAPLAAATDDCTLGPAAGHAIEQPPYILPISAATGDALGALVAAYRARLTDPATALDALCGSAARRRTHLRQRVAVLGRSRVELIAALDDAADRHRVTGSHAGPTSVSPPPLAFVFSGQGAQWPGMASDLLAGAPVFRATVEACEAALRRLAGVRLSLIGALTSRDPGALDDPELTQPAMFAVQAGVVELLGTWGIAASAVVGHSMGEITAAWAAGALTLDQAIEILYHRAQIMRPIDGHGRMVAVALPEAAIESAIEGLRARVSIAALNSPTWNVIAGDSEALDQLLARLPLAATRDLQRRFAFHSPQLAPLEPALGRALEQLRPQPGSLPVYSTLTGQRIDGAALTAAHWQRLASPVRFTAAIGALLDDGVRTFVEISPRPVLAMYIGHCASARGLDARVVPTLRSGWTGAAALTEALAALYSAGCDPDWTRVVGRAAHAELPRYPWQHRRYWFRATAEPAWPAEPAWTAPTATWLPPLRVELSAAPPTERTARIVAHVQDVIGGVLGGDRPRIPSDQPLDGVGLESLMVIEIKSQLERRLAVAIPMELLFRDSTIADIAGAIAGQFATAAAGDTNELTVDFARDALDRLGHMSDSEVDALLRQMMTSEAE